MEALKNDLVRRLNSASTLEEITPIVEEADAWLRRYPRDEDVRGARAAAAMRVASDES